MKYIMFYFCVFSVIIISYHYSLAADKGNKAGTSQSSSSVMTQGTGKVGSAYAFRVNKFKIPLDNKGILGNVSVDGLTQGEYDGVSVIWASGFMMSGKAETNQFPYSELWANGVASVSRIEDYLPGPVTAPNNPNAQLYVVSASDMPFGGAWQDWRDAVALGADFYDGDNDGFYNPIDKNGNGKWDANEDKPDMIGDLTAWCVYNDSKPASQRRWIEMGPRGIEIQQTMWGYKMGGVYGDVLFLRYRIISRGTGIYSGNMDSVYFSVWSDPDLGEYTDDLIGCDTLINSGYVYNNGPDALFGSNPPSFLMRFLQGPVTYIPSVTFIDNNSNGVYDTGIDTPIETAKNVRGPDKGIDSYPGARNQRLSSIVNYVQSDPNRGDPNGSSEALNYTRGRLKDGQILNPCTDIYGAVFGQSCNTINPYYWYSGDPVTNTGWIYTTPGDVRLMVNTGPFKLKPNQPVDIIVGYVIGRGTDAKNSITIAKNNSSITQDFLNRNFAVPSVNIETQVVTGGAQLKIICDGNRVNATAMTATIKTQTGTTVITTPLFDNGLHGDGAAGDGVFANSTSVIAYQDALNLDLSITMVGGSTTLWEKIGSNITTTALNIPSLTIVSDNLNHDLNANTGELVRCVFSVSNPTSFTFENLQVTTTPQYGNKTISIGNLTSLGTISTIYNPSDPNSYFTFYVNTEPTYSINFQIMDNRENIWQGTKTIPALPFESKYSSVQKQGIADGGFRVLISDPTAVKNHLYVIRGVDSIDASKTPGITLKDSTDERILLENHPLPDYDGFNSSPIEGFKIFQGSMQYNLFAKSWSFSPSDIYRWFTSMSFNDYMLSCGACLAPEFTGKYYGWVAGPSSLPRSKYDAVKINFSRKKSFTDLNGNLSYDIGEPYQIDTTNLMYCQKAYFYSRSTTGFGTQCVFSGFKWIPFAAFNINTGKQLDVVILDWDRNGQWDIDGVTISRNIAWIMGTEYDSSGSAYDSTKGGMNLIPAIRNQHPMPSMWVLWMATNGAEPYGYQGELTLTPTYPISARNSFTFNPTVLVSVEEKDKILPQNFSLEQNYPNPFNPSTSIRYTIPKRALVTLKIYNLLGQEVRTIVNEIKDAGTYDAIFNGKNLASGIYFYRLQAGNMTQTKKLVLLK